MKISDPGPINGHPHLSNILEIPPADLKPWPGNPRVHTRKQITKLAASIREFGFTIAILVDENRTILSGHGRVLAALELNLETVPVRMISGLSENRKRAYVIADNKLAQLSEWDGDLLKQELQLLLNVDFETELTGFSTAEIDIMLDESGNSDSSDPDDQISETLPETPVTRTGDLWKLGKHFLYCGSALEADSYVHLMQGQLAQMVITDPPYNVRIAGHVCGSGKVKHNEFVMASGEMSSGQFTDFLKTVLAFLLGNSLQGAIHYYFMDWRHISELLDAAKPHFGEPRQLCVWAKDNGGMGTFYRSQHELVFVFKNGDAPHINNFELGQHGRYRTNVWNYAGVNTFTGRGRELLAMHPTVKPVSLVADAIRDCSHRKGIVLDPFAGSGTILIAAERTGRHARAIEIDPGYVDVAVQRWQRVTGKQAVLQATGQTWDKVVAERQSVLIGGDSR